MLDAVLSFVLLAALVATAWMIGRPIYRALPAAWPHRRRIVAAVLVIGALLGSVLWLRTITPGWMWSAGFATWSFINVAKSVLGIRRPGPGRRIRETGSHSA